MEERVRGKTTCSRAATREQDRAEKSAEGANFPCITYHALHRNTTRKYECVEV